jgi:hypothetical protein
MATEAYHGDCVMNRRSVSPELRQKQRLPCFRTRAASFVALPMEFAFLWLYDASAKVALLPLRFLPFP